MPSSLAQRLRTVLFYALRTAFRLAPLPRSTRDKLRGRFLDSYSALIPSGPKGQIGNFERSRRSYIRSDERAIGYVPYARSGLPDPLPVTLVAFYLPQFHPIPENDEWWGRGFTEWRNVARALPQFEGHRQPKLPEDMGFYDLRNPQVMREQAKLAREYGVGAFCFYFYWFDGKTLLEAPLRNWLADSSVDLSFCLCWANEKWTRTWDGRGDEILIDQKHSPEDDLGFIAYVAEYMRDPRYLRTDGRPVLLVYRPGLFPDIKATTRRWRNWCRENGIGEIHLAYVQSFERPDPRDIGFDAAVEFPPNLSAPTAITESVNLVNPDYQGKVYDWREVSADFRQRGTKPYLVHPGVNCSWDNEPRRPGKGRTYLYSSPAAYGSWLLDVIRRISGHDRNRLIFVNAWNEWAEGAVLEPQALLGHSYLSATRCALNLAASSTPSPFSSTPCALIHAWHLDAFNEILDALAKTNLNWRLVVTTTADKRHVVSETLKNSGFLYEIHALDNRGRDILPFLRTAKLLSDEGVEIVLKLHTKRSAHRNDGDEWRRDLISKLTKADRVARTLEAFQNKPALGVVVPEGHIQPLGYYWGANIENVRYLSGLLGIAWPNPERDHFASGSMFWVRLKAIQPLFDSILIDSDFESEAGQVDGTIAHAIERLFGVCAIQQGYEMTDVATVCGDADLSPDPHYRYAARINKRKKN